MPRASRRVELHSVVQVAKAIGHPARLRILAMLKARPLCVCQMTAVLGLAPSTVSGHLNELRRAGLVLEDKRGKLVFYSLDADSPFSAMVSDTVTLTSGDEVVAQDHDVIERLRVVPIEVLTGAALRLDRLGIRRPRPRAHSTRG